MREVFYLPSGLPTHLPTIYIFCVLFGSLTHRKLKLIYIASIVILIIGDPDHLDAY